MLCRHNRPPLPPPPQTQSFYCFSMQSGFRLMCINIMTQPWFDRIVLLLIIANSITLAAEDPLIKQKCEDPNDPDPPPCENAILVQCEVIFNILFTIEMLIKMVGIGVYGKPSSYLADPWNKMDFFVVCVGWLPTLIEAVNPPQEGEESSGPNLTAIRTGEKNVVAEVAVYFGPPSLPTSSNPFPNPTPIIFQFVSSRFSKPFNEWRECVDLSPLFSAPCLCS